MDPTGRASVPERIRRILLRVWDPICIRDVPAAQDEYDLYVGGVYRMLASRASAEDLAEHLLEIELRQMGLASRPGDLQRTLGVARQLVEIGVVPPSRADTSGMTVNERLHVCGLLEDFGTAAGRRDRETLIALLLHSGLQLQTAEEAVDALLADPLRYGYPPL